MKHLKHCETSQNTRTPVIRCDDIGGRCGDIGTRHSRGVIADPCSVIGDPCVVVAIPEAIGSHRWGEAQITRHRKTLLYIVKHHETLVKHCDTHLKHETSWNTLKTLWNITKHSNTHHSMRRCRQSMQRHQHSVQRHRRSRGASGDCRVGITAKMCNKVTNRGDMGTFSKPA